MRIVTEHAYKIVDDRLARCGWVAHFEDSEGVLQRPGFWSWKKEYAVAELEHWEKTNDA